MSKNINKQFEILYAIAIVLVVISHIPSEAGVSLFYQIFPLYIFNLALFIFCSGYFYDKENEEKPFRFIWKKFKRLIVPLYLINIAYGLIAEILTLNGILIPAKFAVKTSLTGFPMSETFTLGDLFIMPLTNGHQFVYNLATWFVVPLFIGYVFLVLFRRLTRRIIKREFIYLIVCVLLGILGAYLSENEYQYTHLVLLRTLYFIPFLAAGYYYKAVLEKYDRLSNLAYFSVVVGLQIALIYVMNGTFTCSVSWGSYSYMAFAGGILGVAFWLRIARLLTPAIGDSTHINKVANSTYSIMANHFLGFMLIKYLYYCGQKYFGWFQNFNLESFRNDVFYFYYPNDIKLSGLLYVFVAVIFSVWIQDIINITKRRISQNDRYLQTIAFIVFLAIGCFIYIYLMPFANTVIKNAV